MENKKHNISVSENLYKDLKEYCELNSLKLNEFVESILKDAFMVEKYGDAPFFKQTTVMEPATEQKEGTVIVQIPFVSDVPDANGNVFPEEVIVDAIKKFDEKNMVDVTPEKIEHITKEVVENKEKPKRKVTKLK